MLNHIGIGLLLMAWMQPLHFLPWMSWHSEVLAFIAVLFMSAGVLAQIFNTRNPALTVPRAVFPLLLLFAIAVVQVGSERISFVGDGVVISIYLALCLFGLFVGAHTRSLYSLALALLVGAICSVLIELVQAFDVWESVTWISRPLGVRRPGGNLGQPNQLATLLLMGVASLTYLFESRRISAMFAGMLTVLLLCGLAITESRTGVLSLLVMGTWWLISRKSLALRTSFAVVIFAICGFAILLLAWPPFIGFVRAGGWVEEAIVARVDGSVGLRAVVWPQLLAAALQRPWFGWGLREVSEAHNAVLDAYSVGEPFSYAHNIVLDFAIGIGLPLTVLLFTVVTVWGVLRVRAVRSLLPWYCIAMALPFATHSMLEYPFAYAYFLLPVMLAIGVLERELAIGQVFRVSRWVAIALLSITTAVMAWTVWDYVRVEEDFRIVRFEARNVGKTPADYGRPNIVLLTQMSAMLEASRIVPERDMAPERIELSRKAAMRFPWTATQNRYALSLALNGNPDEARRQIKVMRAMHGEGTHRGIMRNWQELADAKYPELNEFIEP